MPGYEQIESFKENGFVIVPDVLNREEVQNLRDFLRAVTDEMPANKRMLTIGEILKEKTLLDALLRIQFDKKLMATLGRIIGPKVAYVNDIQVQCNMFGSGGGGWHIDSGTEANIMINRYLYYPDYRFGKVGVYLQDNTAELGGGINVIPGSHKAFKFFGGNSIAQLAYRYVLNRIQFFRARKFGKELVVPIKAGSAVYFDSRLFHDSTSRGAFVLNEADKNYRRRLKNDTINKDDAKYVFYWDAASQNNAGLFLENAGIRAISEEVGTSRQAGREIFFAEYLSYYYPDDYPDAYVDCVSQSNVVSIACVDKYNAGIWKTIMNSLV